MHFDHYTTRAVCTLFRKHLFKFNFSLHANSASFYTYITDLCVHQYLVSYSGSSPFDSLGKNVKELEQVTLKLILQIARLQ